MVHPLTACPALHLPVTFSSSSLKDATDIESGTSRPICAPVIVRTDTCGQRKEEGKDTDGDGARHTVSMSFQISRAELLVLTQQERVGWIAVRPSVRQAPRLPSVDPPSHLGFGVAAPPR